MTLTISRSTRVASHYAAFMSNCTTISHIRWSFLPGNFMDYQSMKFFVISARLQSPPMGSPKDIYNSPCLLISLISINNENMKSWTQTKRCSFSQA